MTLVVLAGCASTPSQEGLGLPAPNPNGCYLFVYDQSDWQGARAVLNGPGKWSNLERVLLNNEDWRNRIRSIDVGPAATVTVYTDRRFTGVSRRFGPRSKPARLDGEISARIESLDIACPATSQ
jgi:hypothetical protein